MSLITCPECGGKVSTTADACPHCGWRLDKIKAAARARLEKEKESWPSPIDPSWTKKWFRRMSITRLALFLSTILLFGTAIAFTILNAFWPQSFVVSIPCFILAVISFIPMLDMVFLSDIAVREHDGYTVMVYSGLINRLIIEGKVQVQGLFTRYMNGHLPNKTLVRAGIAAWNKSIKIDIGNEHTFR